jgi:hypothetical protein
MPERWERELRKLRGVEPREHVIRDRAARGPSRDRRAPRRNALVAGLVAGAVAIAGVAFLGQLDERGGDIGGRTEDLPTLLVTFDRNGLIIDQPDEQVQRVDTTIVYGDAREENFTSTISENALVDWVGVDELTRFLPGPTAGSPVRIEADGENARILIGRPGDWIGQPSFERFTPIERLPAEPGDYVLLFEADYADGIARTARLVRVVTPGVLQLDITEGKALDAATAAAYVDGRRADGFLTTSSFAQSDVSGQSAPRAPVFGSDGWLPLPSGSPLIVASTVNEARAGLYPSYEDFDPNRRLPIDLLEGAGVIDGPDGRHLLAVEATWKHGKLGWAHEGTEERALFFFPIEIVPASERGEPSPEPTPSPDPTSSDVVTIDIRRSSEETGGPEAIARFGSQEQWMCPDGFSLVNPDGTTDEIVFDCGQSDVFSAPVGMPIEVTGDFATLNVTTRVGGDRVPGSSDVVPALDAGSILTLGYEVTWDDGSHASFWLLLTVQEREPTTEEPGITVRIYGLGERSTEVPIITMTYRGQTRRGCTEAFEWTLDDGTKVDEASGRHGSILPQCSYEPLFLVPPGVPISLEVPTATEVFATRTTTPFYEGRDGFGASVRWAEGAGDFTVTFEVRGDPGTAEIVLDCPEDDRVGFPSPDGPFIMPGGSLFIRGNLAGFQHADVIEQMTRQPGGDTEWAGTWQVVRDGSVIAAVDFSLSGVACRGSGIGGV